MGGNCIPRGTLWKKFPLDCWVSEQETLSLQKSAKSRYKNPNSLRSDMRIFAPNADFRKLRGSKSPANSPPKNPVPELVFLFAT